MKTLKTLVAVAILSIGMFANANATTTLAVAKSTVINTIITDDANVVLTPVKTGSETALQLSFNGNEGTAGTLNVINASGQLVTTINVTLVGSPNFSSVNLSEFASGTYTIELKTTSGVHTSHFTIQ